MTLVVDFDDEDVLSLFQHVADIVVEWREATDVMSHMPAVHIDMAVVVDGTEIQQRPHILHRHGLKTLLEPNCPFIEEQSLVLCVPITGNPHGGRFVEVVLNQVFRLLRLSILEESPSCGVHAVVVIALLLHIDDVVPLAVERHALIGIDVLDQGLRNGCCHREEPASDD